MLRILAALLVVLPLQADASVRRLLQAGDPFPGGTIGSIAFWDDMAAGEALGQLGTTSPDFPADVRPQGVAGCDPARDPEDDGSGVRAMTDFITLLAPLPVAAKTRRRRSSRTAARRRGRATTSSSCCPTGRRPCSPT